MAHDFRKLLIWQRSFDLTIVIYQITKSFPKEEIFGITNQMRRSSSSIPANIAEGSGRNTNKDFAHFIDIAQGSVNEVITFIALSEKLGYITYDTYFEITKEIEEIGQMLAVFCKKLRS